MKNKRLCIVGGEDVDKRIPISKYLIDAGFDVTILGTSSKKFPDNVTYINYNLYQEIFFKKGLQNNTIL